MKKLHDISPDEMQARMRRCLELARRGAGTVSPNPMVGAVIVDASGTVLGEGWHGEFGGPHAEVWAIRDALRAHAMDAFRDATMYVNLEPCSHHGKTPPCADYITEHRIPRVIVGMQDPNPKVSGAGLARLREAGVAVQAGILEPDAFRLNEAFIHHVRTGKPLVTLKIAQTLDGQVATASGDSRWISGKEARILVHQWRTEIDGVLVGRGTADADDPALTVRHVAGRQPVRVVLDGAGSLPPGLRLFQDEHAASTVALTAPGVVPAYANALQERGGRVLEVARAGDGRLDLRDLLALLGREGGAAGRPMQSIMVEAGRALATSFFRASLVNRYFLFIAPKLVGTGVSTIGDLAIERMAEARTFAKTEWEMVGDDLLFRGYTAPAPGD